MRSGRVRRSRAVSLVGGLLAVTAVASSVQTPAISATPSPIIITVTGDCANEAASTDWQSVLGVAPQGAPSEAVIEPGTTMRIVNNCDPTTQNAGIPGYAGELIVQQSPAAWFGGTKWPNLTGAPTFSDNATWTPAASANDRAYGTLVRGAYVEFVVAPSTGRFIFEDMLAAWLGGSDIFAGGTYYGGFAVLSPLDISSGGNPITQVVASTSNPIAPITLNYSGFGAGGLIVVDQQFPLPQGLSFSSSQQFGAYTLPATITGTPTQDGVYTVKFQAIDPGAFNRYNPSGNSLEIIVGPAIFPATQTVASQAGTQIASTAAFTASNFSGNVSYSVTGQTQLPAGLTLAASTGVISGTPTATSTDTVTIEATDGTNTATATVTFAITAAPAPPPPPPAAPVTTAPPTTAPPATLPNVPALVNFDNQASLTRTPGAATAIVNGVVVAVEIEAPADLPAAQKDPEDRSPAEVAALQTAAESLVDELNEVAGGDSGLSVVPSPTGASISGLMSVPVPIENTVIVKTDEQSTMFAALNQDGSVTEVQPGAQIEVLGNGQVGVAAFGLTPGETVEFVLMSTPTLLGRFEVNAQGGIKAQAQLPSSVGSGSHTLVVASPSVKASLGLKIGTPAAPTLPVTGGDAGDLAPVMLLLAVGAVLVVVSRRRITLVP